MNVQRAGSSASPRAVILAGAGIALTALAVYHNSFSGPFIFDDPPAIDPNMTIRHLWPLWPVLSPPPESTVVGRPVLNLSLALNYAISGKAVWSYHAFNLAIHILAGLTLFGLVRRTLERCRKTESNNLTSDIRPLTSAFCIALLWTVHPLQTEAVTYVIQRTESLMGLFYLLTLYCFVRYAEEPDGRCQKAERIENWLVLCPLSSGIWLLSSVLCCLLGMASKEVMVSAPLMVLLYDRTFVAGTFREAWRQRRRFYFGLASTWLLLGYLVLSAGGNRSGSVGFGLGMSAWHYLLTQCRAITMYLKLSVWPHPLVFDYGTSVAQSLPEVFPQAVLLVLLFAASLWALWRRRALGFVALWFFAILAPSSSIVPIITQTMAEHRMYLPLAAVVTLVVLGLYAALGRRSLYLCLGLAAGSGVLTAQRNKDYRSLLVMWNDTAMKCPNNPRAHNNLGEILARENRTGLALGEFREALRLDPDNLDAHCNLGTILAKLGQVSLAITEYKKALYLSPANVPVHFNLANAYLQMGRLADAIREYQATLKLDPHNAGAYNNLGNIFYRQGQWAEAARQFQEVLRLDPTNADAQYNLAQTQAHL